MHKIKARWAALFTALLLICSFAFAACDGESEGDLGAIRDIYIVTADLKTTYTVGEVFDYSAVKLRAVYENGDESLTAADADKGVSHTELDMAKSGTQTLTVTYKEKSASVAINVVAEEKAVLKGLQFSGGTTAYTVNDDIDYHSFTLTAIYSVGADRTLYGDSQGVTHNNISTAGEGEKELTFTYTDGGVSKSVIVTIIVSAGPVPVTLISIEVQSAAADRSVAFGAEFDYSKFTIVPHYSDGHTVSNLKGDSDGVTHTNVDTTLPGEQEITFTYEEVTSAPVTITVLAEKLNLRRFALPKFYSDVSSLKDDTAGTASEDRDSFMKGFESYKVGDDNAFEFQPDATVLLSLTQELAVTVRTTFTLEIKGDGDVYTSVAADQYVTTNPLLPNYYYFTEAAVGKVFKLKIKPDSESYTGATEEIEAIIEVVDGYNVYNQIGLSVFDNLNVKHWHDVKEAAGTLRWDDKPLVDYNTVSGDKKTPVKNIVLHGDINIDPDKLPDSYFWQTTDDGYSTVNDYLQNNGEIPDSVKKNLDGSLKDGLNKDQYYKFDDETSGDLNEDAKTSVNMQKGVYVSTGTGIEGNFHEITYRTSGAKHSLYTVYDGKSTNGTAFPLSHWSLFKYGKANTADVEIVNEGKPHISDLRILGQSPRKAATDGEPSHLMAFNTCTNEVNLENTIVSRLFVVVLGDKVSSTEDADGTEVAAGVNVSDSKFFDIYSNMFYLWRATIDVKRSIMEDAGGPVFILCDGNRKATDNGAAGSIIVDKASRLKSEASGNESWYTLNNANAIFTKLKSEVRGYITTGTKLDPMHKGTGEVELYNVIAIVVPEPSSLQTAGSDASNTYYPKGTIKRGEDGSYTDDYAVDWKFAEGGLFSSLASQMPGIGPDYIYNSMAPIFISGTEKTAYVASQYLYASSEDLAWSSADTVNYAERGTDWLFITLRAADKAPRFGILFGDVVPYSA